jgi:hypothetical protein
MLPQGQISFSSISQRMTKRRGGIDKELPADLNDLDKKLRISTDLEAK